MTLLPSFHISVTSVWPGMTTPAKRTLISWYSPNVLRTCLPAIPIEQRPCRTGWIKGSARVRKEDKTDYETVDAAGRTGLFETAH